MSEKTSEGIRVEALLSQLDTLRLHARLMVLLLALGLTGGLIFYTYSRSVFHAKSLVHVVRVERPVDERNLPAKTVFIDSNDSALLQEFGSDEVVRRTAKRLGVPNPRAKSAYLKKIQVDYNSNGDLIVEVWPYTLELARDWTAAMVQEYLLYREEKRQEAREATVHNLIQEGTQIRKIISEALNQEVSLKDTNNMSRLLLEVQQLNDIPRELLEVNRRLSLMAKARQTLANTNQDAVARLSLVAFMEASSPMLRRLQLMPGQTVSTGGPSDTNNSTVIVPSMLNPTVAPWEDLDREKRRLLGQMRQWETTYGSGHPKMIDLRKQIEKVNHALDLELEAANQRFDLQYANLQERQVELEARLPEVQATTRRYEQNQAEIKRIGASSAIWDTIQDQMTRLVNVLGFWGDKQRVELQFMGHLELENGAVAPNQQKIFLGSLLLGLGLAVSLPFLLRYLDTRMTTLAQVEEELDLDPLGLIPEDIDIGTKDVRKLKESAASVNENFRLVRSNLMLRFHGRETPQVILIASALPGEGKSTVVVHMARSFAEKGEATLMVDADLYRGRLHRVFEVAASPGFSEVIRQQATAVDCCLSVGENLSLMPCGKRDTGHSTRIDSQEFTESMRALRARYKHIFLDSPPILGLSEVSLLQPHVDGVIVVFSCKSTTRMAAEDAVETLRANGAKIYGFLLNRADMSSLQSRYRYYYYSKDYYSKYAEAGAQAATLR